MATIVNARDVLLQAAGTRFVTPALTGTIVLAQVTDAGDLAAQDTVGAGQLDPGIVTTAAFAASIEPVGIVAAVPGVKSTEMVFNTADSKLYRWNGSAYVATVASTDISGTLTDAQIADVAAAKLTGQITETQITDSAVTTAKINAGAVSTAKLAAAAVTANEIASDAVTAAKILAGSVTTAKLAAGAVTANELAAGSVTAGKVAAGAISTTELAAGAVTAAKIGAGQVTADKLTVASLSAITANLGTVTAGTIQGTANINVTGLARFEGNTSPDSISLSAALVANDTGGRDYGVWSKGVVAGVYGYSLSAGGAGVWGSSASATGIGVRAGNAFGGTALKVEGPMTIDNTTKVVNLNADLLDGNEAAAFAAAAHNHTGVYSPVANDSFVTDSGTATASAGINFNCTITGYQFTGSSNNVGLAPVSDRRLKEGVVPETLGLAFINQLKPVSYRMKGKPRTHHGFVAQDVEEIIRGRGVFSGDDALAVESPDGVKGVDYIALIAPLVKAMQEIDAKINALEGGRAGA